MRNAIFSALIAAGSLVATVHGAPADSILAAAERHDAAAVRQLLKEGADVNAGSGDGTTALHVAALDGDVNLASMLLYAGANVRATTRLGGYTPLHLAARAGQTAVVSRLLAAGAAADERTATGATALMLAARSGQLAAVQALLAAGANVNAKESTYGQTPLMFAAAFDRADIVALLATRGAALNTASTFVDLNALGLPEPPTARSTATEGKPDPAERRPGLSEPGTSKKPDVAGVTRPFRYNELIGGQGGLTALHYAARQGSAGAVAALVDAGADLDAPSPADRTTPLLIAIINGQFDIASYLLDHGANPNRTSDAGAAPLYAVLNVQWSPKAAYPQPRAYLQQQHTYLDLLRALLDKGADPNARLNRKIWYSGYNFDQSNVDESGATPFWRAAYAADVDAMKLLVAHGADPAIPTMRVPHRRDPDSPDTAGDVSGLPPVPMGGPAVAPLHAASGVGYGKGFAGNSHHYAPGGLLPAVKYLVDELHVDVNARDDEGNTALHHAASRGDTAMIEYLVSKGADVTAVNRAGQTTVDMANGPVQRVQPFPDAIALLEKLGAKNNHKCVSCD